VKPPNEPTPEKQKARRQEPEWFGVVKKRELTPEEKQRAKEYKKRDEPNFFQMLNSIIDWKIDDLRKELTTSGAKPLSKLREAEAWLASTCPTLFQYVSYLDKAGLLERTADGFNWKFQQAALVLLLQRCGFNNWKNFGRYCRINDRQAKVQSLKNQVPGSHPKGWEKIIAAIPELRSSDI